MSAQRGVVAAQLEALLDLVEDFRSRSCREIEEQARARAEETVARARQEARVRMHAAVEHERARAQETLASTRARLLTQRRHGRQALDKRLAAQAWTELRPALARRWRNADQRRAWVEALVRRADELLPGSTWRVEHPPGWDAEEMSRLDSRESASGCGRSLTFVADPEIEAGLRIRVDGTCLDGTTQGLLADRPAVEAELLGEVHR